MNCRPELTDRAGIFRCPVCGLQNPRPIKKPFIAQCGPREPPEPPYDNETAAWIVKTLCPPCKRYEAGKCKTTSTCKRGGMKIELMIERGQCCPLGNF